MNDAEALALRDGNAEWAETLRLFDAIRAAQAALTLTQKEEFEVLGMLGQVILEMDEVEKTRHQVLDGFVPAARHFINAVEGIRVRLRAILDRLHEIRDRLR